jgi:molecular chaperone DnaJ
MKQDYYEVLGVSKNATDQEIKSAFRKLSRKYHPDMQAGKSDTEKKDAEEKFKTIAEAYEILSDKNKRSNYDQFGFDGPKMGNGFDGFDMSEFMARHAGMFGDMFEGGFNFGGMFGGSPFGHNARQNREPDFKQPEHGKHVHLALEIPFKDAINGCTRTFDIKLTKPCPECGGTGIEKDSKPIKCDKCNGTGHSVKISQNGFMVQQIISECPHCHGTGYKFTYCKKCNGEKRIKDTKHIEIKIPAGIDNGQRLRIPGKGHCGVNGGENGHLFVEISVEHQDVFERIANNDVITNIDIDPITAMLGGTIVAASPYGFINVDIKAGTKSGTIIKMKNHGIKTSTLIGDLHIKINIAPFEKLSSEQKQLLEQLKTTITSDNFSFIEKYKSKVEKVV